jgi:glycosyltransferase involved in cell wall biosynthesis
MEYRPRTPRGMEYRLTVGIVVSAVLALLQGLLLACLGYQAILAVASAWPSRPVSAARSRRLRFAIAIPAHNEASVLPATLARLREQSYPKELFDVHVVADHCTDATADVTRQGGGIAHERNDPPDGRKAYALQWLLQRILQREPASAASGVHPRYSIPRFRYSAPRFWRGVRGPQTGYDAVAVFDADSLVDPGFLDVMEGHLSAGKPVLQGQHIISNPQDSPLAAMAAVDMRLNNRLRNQSRSNLGFSCRLMGDAMVFDARVLREHGWPSASLNEDREYGYELLLHGMRASYVPEARSYGQAVSTWRQAEPQRLRWYREVPAMQGRYAGPLLAAAFRSRSLAPFDGAVELLMPPYSVLVALSAINLVLVAAWRLLLPPAGGLLGVAASVGLLGAWLLYPVLGLCIDRAPAWAYRALLLGPVYLIWRLWIAVLVRLRGDRISWVRTQRREESNRSGR